MLWHLSAGWHRLVTLGGVLLALLSTISQIHAQNPLLPPIAVRSAAPSSAKSSPESPGGPAVRAAESADQVIPLPQIADRAEALDALLREIKTQLKTKDELDEAEHKAKVEANQNHERVRQAKEFLSGVPTPLELDAEQRNWKSRAIQFSEERKSLSTRAAKLEEQINVLDGQRPIWQLTWDRIHNISGLESVAARIRSALDSIEAMHSEALEQLNFAVRLQNQISQEDQEITEVLGLFRQARQEERTRLLNWGAPPLWEVFKSRQGGAETHKVATPESLHRSFIDTNQFLQGHQASFFFIALSYVLVLISIFRMRRSVSRSAPSNIPPDAVQVLNAPFSVALLIILLGTAEFVDSAPMEVAFFLHVLYLVPLLRLVHLWSNKLRRAFYVSSALYLCQGLYLVLELPSSGRRALSAGITILGLGAFAWVASPVGKSQDRTHKVAVVVLRIAVLFVTVSLLANILGLVSLAQVLLLTVVTGLFNAMALFCGARVLTLMLRAVLGTRGARNLPIGRANAIDRWGTRIVHAGALVMWTSSVLHLLTLYDSAVGMVSSILRKPIGIERIHFTLGDALGLMLILLGGYALANTLVFLLKIFVLPRLPLQRGLPFAISTITYYVLLILVALAALSATGVELNKFTVLTGALGVGLGFGLQNIVNNFVSGLILICERPIHVGDTVDVGGLVGIVRRIGARSSTVVTFQGAEVIVPNSNLLSNQVINWTLSSPWRRVDVPVRVAYGTDPEKVLKLLVDVAESCRGVLLERPPAAFFLGFGDSALNFELRFWSARQDTWLQLQSEVTVAVAKALRAAGIEIPFPQRDLHLRSVSPAVTHTLEVNETSSTFVPRSAASRVRA